MYSCGLFNQLSPSLLSSCLCFYYYGILSANSNSFFRVKDVISIVFVRAFVRHTYRFLSMDLFLQILLCSCTLEAYTTWGRPSCRSMIPSSISYSPYSTIIIIFLPFSPQSAWPRDANNRGGGARDVNSR